MAQTKRVRLINRSNRILGQFKRTLNALLDHQVELLALRKQHVDSIDASTKAIKTAQDEIGHIDRHIADLDEVIANVRKLVPKEGAAQ